MEDQLRQVFARVFNVPLESVTDESSPQTVVKWNSAGHLDLVLEIESQFNIQLSDEEVVTMVNFRRVRDTVSQHVNSAR